jgi:hypothetical protein
MGISLLFVIITNVPLKFIMREIYNEITYFLVSEISLIIGMFALFFRDGYRARKIELKPFAIGLLIQFSLMVIFTLFIGPAIYVSGPTNILAREIAFSYDLGPTATKVMSNRYSLLLMIIAYIIVYVPIMIFAERLGIKKRNKLFKNKNTKSFKN